MSTPSRETALVAATTITANGNTGILTIPDKYLSCVLYATTTAASGTSPTLDVYIQECFTAQVSGDTTGVDLTSSAIPTIFDDYAHFAQFTGNASQKMRIYAGTGTSASNAPTAIVASAQSGALAASTVQPGPIGMFWRVLWKVGGTSPSFSLTVTAQFFNSPG